MICDPLPHYDTAMGAGIVDLQDAPITGYCELCGTEIYGEPHTIGGFWNLLEVCEECFEEYSEEGIDDD